MMVAMVALWYSGDGDGCAGDCGGCGFLWDGDSAGEGEEEGKDGEDSELHVCRLRDVS